MPSALPTYFNDKEVPENAKDLMEIQRALQAFGANPNGNGHITDGKGLGSE